MGGIGQEPDKKAIAAVEAFLKQAEFSFKVRDRNRDGFLDKDEMPKELRDELTKYDKDRDGRLSFEEYLEYKLLTHVPPPTDSEKPKSPSPDKPAPAPEKPPPPPPPPTPPRVIVIDEDELDRRPAVYRAGKLPKGMPSWFEKMDVDEDGQIALWEWRKAGHSIKEFSMWDRNGDGFISIAEVMYRFDQERLAALKGGKPLPVGTGLEFRETMIEGSTTSYFVKFEKGVAYQIDMTTDTPQTLDPFLFVYDHEGRLLVQDDDSGGNLNARIFYKSTGGRNVRIVAASVGNRGNGDYILSIRQKD